MEIIERRLPTKSYQKLRVLCGLSSKTDEAVNIGLKKSVFSVMVKDGAKLVGMGRIVGDGGCFCQVVDICVHPNYKGKGVGKKVMKSIQNHIENELPTSCYVSLIADGKANYLYEKFGFKNTMPESRGMYLKVS